MTTIESTRSDLTRYVLIGAEEEVEGDSDTPTDLIRLGAVKWRKGRAPVEAPRYIEKAPKFVKPKMSPRTIQQPR